MTFLSSRIDRGPRGSDKILIYGRPQRSNLFPSRFFCGVLNPHPCRLPLGNFHTMVMWQQIERDIRVTASL